MINSWRENLKSGPLQRLYLLARNSKRRLRGEPMAGTVPLAQVPLPVEELRSLAAVMPDHGRLYYSLGLGYVDADTCLSDLKALSCFRCAESLGFEAPERTTLYKALIVARRGDGVEAARLVASLSPDELTEAESEILSKLLRGGVAPYQDIAITAEPGWDSVRQQLADSYLSADSLLVIGDSKAVSAQWLPKARYLHVEPDVTGLTIESAGAMGLQFAIGIAPDEQRDSAEQAGIVCSKWLTPV